MLAIYALLVRRSTESHAQSALPTAPVEATVGPAPAAATRRVIAARLIALADRVSPEPLERSPWQRG